MFVPLAADQATTGSDDGVCGPEIGNIALRRSDLVGAASAELIYAEEDALTMRSSVS